MKDMQRKIANTDLEMPKRDNSVEIKILRLQYLVFVSES